MDPIEGSKKTAGGSSFSPHIIATATGTTTAERRGDRGGRGKRRREDVGVRLAARGLELLQ